ncbi:MAG: ATP-binding protein [Planctomycetaceae bacterium]
MSYRSFKRVLGETSLERKCLVLFGGGLLLLITASFYFYARLNLRVVREQYNKRADLLITANLQAEHWSKLGGESSAAGDEPGASPVAAAGDPAASMSVGNVLEFAETFKPDVQRELSWRFIAADLEHASAEQLVRDSFEDEARGELLEAVAELEPEERLTSPPSLVLSDPEKDTYLYFRAIIADESCVRCHQQMNEQVQLGSMLGVAKIAFPRQEAEHEIARNNAILIAMAIVTCFLAMGGAYAIVRYVIVKPVLHLKDVSDAVAQGDLDQRADIHTGDEFEELSHAFNRMLRRLVTVQGELREVNQSLDAKVDELAQANLSLHEMNKLKSDFLATMSHELRTPLNSILGFSDLLSEAQTLNERQRKYVSNIQLSGRNLLQLINDILDLAKIEAGKMELAIVDFSLAELVERLSVGMLPLAERKNIELQWDSDPRVDQAVQDAGKLQQILYNLLSNAIKFTPEGGRVDVRAVPAPDDCVEVIVADTGIGIPLDDQARIFERFRQGRSIPGSSDHMTREFEGTGLGLSIVNELSRLLGGEVKLHSEFGKGSTFSVRIPLRLDRPEAGKDEDRFRRQTVERRKQQTVIEEASRTDAKDDSRASRGAPASGP